MAESVRLKLQTPLAITQALLEAAGVQLQQELAVAREVRGHRHRQAWGGVGDWAARAATTAVVNCLVEALYMWLCHV